MTDLVERLVPDELWVLLRRVVPATEVKRPLGGGRRRAGDREALAAIAFVATSGCTWRQLPPVFGPCWQTVYLRFAQWSRDRLRQPCFLRQRGIKATIAQPDDHHAKRKRKGRARRRPPVFGKAQYRRRSAVERCVSKWKQYRAVASRFFVC